MLAHEDRHGIHLFARRTPRNPDTYRIAGIAVFEETRDDLGRQGVEGIAVAEEVRDIDEQVAEERTGFLHVVAQTVQVRIHLRELQYLHAPAHPANEGACLVAAEIVADLPDKRGIDRRQGDADVALDHRVLQATRRVSAARGGLCQVHDLLPEFFGGQREIHQAGEDGRIGHVRMPGTEAVVNLGEREAAVFLDRLQTQRPIRIAAGQDDAKRALAEVDGQRAEEDVDGPAFTLGRAFVQDKTAFTHAHRGVGRHDIDGVGFDDHAVLDNLDRKGCVTRDHFMEQALPVRTEVRGDDERHARVGGHLPEQPFQGLDTACGGADTGDEKVRPGVHGPVGPARLADPTVDNGVAKPADMSFSIAEIRRHPPGASVPCQ